MVTIKIITAISPIFIGCFRVFIDFSLLLEFLEAADAIIAIVGMQIYFGPPCDNCGGMHMMLWQCKNNDKHSGRHGSEKL
jgi:hypothetical protein